jgi:preprotein translocase subunit SecB
VSGPLPNNYLDVIAGTGGTILLPFLREVIANFTGRGRFGPVWVNPINFRAALQNVKGEMILDKGSPSVSESTAVSSLPPRETRSKRVSRSKSRGEPRKPKRSKEG